MKRLKHLLTFIALGMISSTSFANVQGYSPKQSGSHFILVKNNKCADIPTDSRNNKIISKSVISWRCKNADWQKWDQVSPNVFQNVQHPHCIFNNVGLKCNSKTNQEKVSAPVAQSSIPITAPSKPVTKPTPTPVVTIPNNQGAVEHTYAKNDGPNKNPHKGWNSGWWDDIKEASVGFQYLDWKDFEPKDGQFNTQAVENLLNRPGTKGRHFVIRLYCDWYGAQQTSQACPSWLYSDMGVKRLRGENGKYITDYNNPKYIEQATQAIKALATYFGNDPRAHAIQIGVLGYWGEWHTWGSKFGGNQFTIKDSTKNAILKAYKESFPHVKLQGRYPWKGILKTTSGIGFHNDFFVPNNGHSDEFDDAISIGQQWRDGPIGGESPPRGGSEGTNEKIALTETSQGMNMITSGHYTTMKPGYYQIEKGERGYDGYMRLHNKMGYNYQIDTATFSKGIASTDKLTVNVNVDNIGVAPLYYNWDVQFALLDGNNKPVKTSTADFDLTTALPGEMFTLSTSMPLMQVNAGQYRLAVRIIQPDADMNKSRSWKLDARNTYILFSNNLPVINGSWSSQHALTGGWSVLGDVSVN